MKTSYYGLIQIQEINTTSCWISTQDVQAILDFDVVTPGGPVDNHWLIHYINDSPYVYFIDNHCNVYIFYNNQLSYMNPRIFTKVVDTAKTDAPIWSPSLRTYCLYPFKRRLPVFPQMTDRMIETIKLATDKKSMDLYLSVVLAKLI